MINLDEIKSGYIYVLGIPTDENSSFLKGSALAPDKIREAYNSDSANKCSESCIDLGIEKKIRDIGNLEIIDIELLGADIVELKLKCLLTLISLLILVAFYL